MANFFAEMKRRQIYRVAVTYVVVAWLLLQVVNNVAPILDLPPWIARAILLLLIIGFPLALIFAWIHQLAPARAAAAPVPAATGKPSGITESARGFLLRRFGRSTGLAPRRASLAPKSIAESGKMNHFCVFPQRLVQQALTLAESRGLK
jgi:hypothetical protein